MNKKNLLHSQSILAHGFPAIFVATRFLLEEEALREPKSAVFSLSTGNQHAYHKDDQKEKRSYPHQHQFGPLRYSFRNCNLFTCGEKTKKWLLICASLVLPVLFVFFKYLYSPRTSLMGYGKWSISKADRAPRYSAAVSAVGKQSSDPWEHRRLSISRYTMELQKYRRSKC